MKRIVKSIWVANKWAWGSIWPGLVLVCGLSLLLDNWHHDSVWHNLLIFLGVLFFMIGLRGFIKQVLREVIDE